jgi:hypothetical protein
MCDTLLEFVRVLLKVGVVGISVGALEEVGPPAVKEVQLGFLIVSDEALDAVQLLGEPPGRLEGERAPVAGAMVHDFHRARLLHPQLAHDYVVHVAVDVAPCVRLAPPDVQNKRLCVNF